MFEMGQFRLIKQNYLFKVIIFLLLFLVECTFSQSTWTRTIGGPLDDLGWSTFQTKDGNILLIGEKTVLSKVNSSPISQTYLVKLNPFGTILWNKTYGDSIYHNFSYSAAEDSIGNLYIASNWGSPTLLKTDYLGNIIFQKGYNLPIVTFAGISVNQNSILLYGTSYNGTIYSKGLTKLDLAAIYFGLNFTEIAHILMEITMVF